MDTAISCSPPLGLLTAIDTADVEFTVGVGVANFKDWEIALWHNNSPNGEWAEAPLEKINIRPHLPIHGGEDRVYFRGSLCRTGTVVKGFNFTLKFRQLGSPWQWVRDVYGLQDGHVVFRSKEQTSPRLDEYISHLNQNFSLHPSETGKCHSWELRTSVPGAEERTSGSKCARLGKLSHCIRWFALVRHSVAWLGPRQGHSRFDLDEDAVLVSFLMPDGLHLALLALSGIDDMLVTLRGDSEGHIVVESRNERPTNGTARVFAAISPEWSDAITAAFDAAKTFAKSARSTDGTSSEVIMHESTHEGCGFSKWRDGLTYCTWNGLGQNLSSDKIHAALDLLAATGIKISNLIIDDNWQSLENSGDDNFYHRWTDFEANKEHFPGGLRDLISRVRVEHPSIRNIAVWHGVFGYWGGTSMAGGIAKKYMMRTFKRREGIFLGGGEMTAVDGEDARRLFDDFYRFLIRSGVNAVKTDTQSFLDYPEFADDRLALITPYQEAWRASSTEHFGSNVIACMAQIPQAIFQSFMRDDLPKIMMRNSDDFFPDEASSHSWHLFCNAHNAVLTEHLNVLPDWDMFQTAHDFSSFHGAARCLSGGPICLTDVPGDHDMALIEKMTAGTPDGRVVILRPGRIGRTSEIYNSHADHRLLRIQAEHRDTSIIGVFNVGKSTLTEFQRLREFHIVSNTVPYVIHHHESDHIFGPFLPQDDRALIELSVPEHGFELLTAHPVYVSGETSVAVLGLLGKMVPSAAIIKCEYATLSTGIELKVSLKALGTLGIFTSERNFSISRVSVTVQGHHVADLAGVSVIAGTMLRIQLDRLWKASSAMDSGETAACVDVDILMR